MPIQQPIDDQFRLLAIYRSNLAFLCRQAALYGGEAYAPLPLWNNINEQRAEIQRIKSLLLKWNVVVEDLPDERTTSDATLVQGRIDPVPEPPVFEHNPLFVGRKNILDQLAAELCGDHTIAVGQPRTPTPSNRIVTVAVTGMGGIGKTEVAAEFVHRYRDRFPGGVFWLSFANPDSIAEQIARYGLELNWESSSDTSVPSDRTDETMSSPAARLLIFDGCEEPALVRRWRPHAGLWQVLLTSRRSHWHPRLGVRTISLDVLDRAESIALLRTYRPDLAADDPGLDAVADELGDLPLTLDVAGSFLQEYEHFETPESYLAQLRAPDLLEAGWSEQLDPALADALAGVAPTFAVSYTQLCADDPTDALALQVLARMAYFEPGKPIERVLLTAALGLTGRNALHRFEDALRRLITVGLLKETSHTTVWIHRILGVFIRSISTDAEAPVDVCNVLSMLMSSEARPEAERRAIASYLTHLRWLDIVPSVSADKLIAYLELVVRYIGSNDRRRYLCAKIDTALSVDLSKRQRAQLLVFQATMYGQLRQLRKAATNYQEAVVVIGELLNSTARQGEDLHLAARINLGAGNVAQLRAESLPEDHSSKHEDLRSVAKFYEAAAAFARAYGRDVPLKVGIGLELIHLYATLDDDPAVSQHFTNTLRMLNKERSVLTDRAVARTYYAQLIQECCQVSFEKSKRFFQAGQASEALHQCLVAYARIKKAIHTLERSYKRLADPVLIPNLALAHYSAGEYLFEMRTYPGRSIATASDEACCHWKTAYTVARHFGIADEADMASEKLDQHCPGWRTSSLPLKTTLRLP